jgi:thiosulfate/3-mercaptopyruvate sulfurtransferase
VPGETTRGRALISTDQLAGELGRPGLRVVDVRWYLDRPRHGREAYAAGHLPGAMFLDIEADLSAPGGGRGLPAGRHPWPSPEQVARVMGAAGIDGSTRVVAYDDQAGATAARLWFVLRAHGHDDVAVLDGGLQKWVAEGRPLSNDVEQVARATFAPRLRPELLVDKAAMRARPADALVLDARAAARYRGEVEPIDPRAGHVPGAKSAPFSANLTEDALPVLRAPDDLRRHYAALGAEAREPIVYCGSGVTACHDLLALHLAGLGGRLYAGSWSEWSSDQALPVATGDEPA